MAEQLITQRPLRRGLITRERAWAKLALSWARDKDEPGVFTPPTLAEFDACGKLQVGDCNGFGAVPARNR